MRPNINVNSSQKQNIPMLKAMAAAMNCQRPNIAACASATGYIPVNMSVIAANMTSETTTRDILSNFPVIGVSCVAVPRPRISQNYTIPPIPPNNYSVFTKNLQPSLTI